MYRLITMERNGNKIDLLKTDLGYVIMVNNVMAITNPNYETISIKFNELAEKLKGENDGN